LRLCCLFFRFTASLLITPLVFSNFLVAYIVSDIWFSLYHQHNGQKKKRQKDRNNVLQINTLKTKYWATRTPLTTVLRTGQQFLLHSWHMSIYSYK
jgi:hypothetical protein